MNRKLRVSAAAASWLLATAFATVQPCWAAEDVRTDRLPPPVSTGAVPSDRSENFGKGAENTEVNLGMPAPATTSTLLFSDPDLLKSRASSALPLFGGSDSFPTTFSTYSSRFKLPETPLPVEELDALTSSAPGARRINMLNAVFRALECNQALRLDRLRPEITNTGIESAESEFDTTLNASASAGSRHSPTLGARSREETSGSDERIRGERVSRSSDANVSLGGRLPTGTDYNLALSLNRGVTDSTLPFYTGEANFSITQNLLKGAGTKVNMVRVWTAENNFVISLYQLQQVLLNLVADTQNAYYDLYLAQESLLITRRAHEVARQLRQSTEEFVRVGKTPPLDLLSAEAEESARVSNVINAAAEVKRRQLAFLRLLNPDGFRNGWDTRVYPAQGPIVPKDRLVVDDHVALALRYRPDLKQGELDLANGELEVYRSHNGLLPALDFFVDAGYTGVGDSATEARRDITSGDYPNWRGGLQFSYPLQNRQARASYRRATFQRQVAEESLVNFRQLIEIDVRNALIDIDRTGKLIASTQVTRILRREELLAEIEKYRVGRSTQLLVAQAQRDLIQAALDAVAAQVSHTKAYVQLYKVEGTLLQRCGISPILITPESGVGRTR